MIERRPLTSVMTYSSAEVVASMLHSLYPDCSSVLDCTYGAGAFWKNGHDGLALTTLDKDPARKPDIVADFTALPFAGGSFHAVVFDPPHRCDNGKASIMGARYGGFRDAAEMEAAIRAGAREAWRVARIGVIVKLADHVHGQRLVLLSDWIRAELGVPYEVVHQARRVGLADGKWNGHYSARRNHSTYFAFRRGDQRHIARGWQRQAKARTR
jgi:hypothetical protein